MLDADLVEWKHLILDVIIADDEKTIKSVFADSKPVLSNITEEDLSVYLKQLGEDGWEFVHVHTRDQLYRVYYFKRRKEKRTPETMKKNSS
jgi:hypothetical protein